MNVYLNLQEMLRCDGVTIDVNPQDKLPTVSADQSDNITIKYHLPQAVSGAPTPLSETPGDEPLHGRCDSVAVCTSCLSYAQWGLDSAIMKQCQLICQVL